MGNCPQKETNVLLDSLKMIPSSPDKAIENSTKIAQAIIVAISRGRKGIAEEEYETGINFLKKIYENLHSGAPSG